MGRPNSNYYTTFEGWFFRTYCYFEKVLFPRFNFIISSFFGMLKLLDDSFDCITSRGEWEVWLGILLFYESVLYYFTNP